MARSIEPTSKNAPCTLHLYANPITCNLPPHALPIGTLITLHHRPATAQVWDITGGRQIHEFRHDNAVTGIEFHPHEFLLGTSSTDKTSRLWDLESFEAIETLGPELTGVRAMTFHPAGRHLLSALADGLRVWGWEPLALHDNVDVPWSKVRGLLAVTVV